MLYLVNTMRKEETESWYNGEIYFLYFIISINYF